MAHGETRAQAIEQIGIAIQNWLDTAREIGREIPSIY
jgi:predicted RNase H-like HicB family nuclease